MYNILYTYNYHLVRTNSSIVAALRLYTRRGDSERVIAYNYPHAPLGRSRSGRTQSSRGDPVTYGHTAHKHTRNGPPRHASTTDRRNIANSRPRREARRPRGSLAQCPAARARRQSADVEYRGACRRPPPSSPPPHAAPASTSRLSIGSTWQRARSRPSF